MLAVSGLHVGVVFLFCNSLLSLFLGGNLLRRRIVRTILVLLCLWTYVWLTQFSPSVVRAAVMFSFLQGAYLLRRPFYAYASVFSSAFLMLVANPDYLFNVGFQLSYVAVLSILYFHPRIYGLFSFGNLSLPQAVPSFLKVGIPKIIDKAWSLTAVSIAAQIGTAPLVLYYFHQFSFVFWLSGLVVVPLSALIIFLTLAYLAVNFVPMLSSLVFSALVAVAQFMNWAVSAISSLPGAYVNGVDFRFPELILALSAILLMAFYLSFKRYAHLFASVACVLALVGISVGRCVLCWGSGGLVVANVPNESVVNVFGVSGNHLYATADSTQVEHMLAGFWARHHVSYAQISPSCLLVEGQHSAYVLNKDISKLPSPSEPIPVHCLVISSDVRIPLQKLTSFFSFNRLVVDSSCSLATSVWWKGKYPMAHLVRTDGDYVELF